MLKKYFKIYSYNNISMKVSHCVKSFPLKMQISNCRSILKQFETIHKDILLILILS